MFGIRESNSKFARIAETVGMFEGFGWCRGIRSVLSKNPCQIPAVVEGVVRIGSNDVGEFHCAAFGVQHDDSCRNRLIDSAEPTLNRDAKRPQRSLESQVVVAPGFGEQIGLVGDNVLVRTPCHGYKPFGPNPCVVGHVCDVPGGIPPEVRESFCTICACHQLVDRVRKTAHQRDQGNLFSGPSKSAFAAWIPIERCPPVVHPRSIPCSHVNLRRGNNDLVSLWDRTGAPNGSEPLPRPRALR